MDLQPIAQPTFDSSLSQALDTLACAKSAMQSSQQVFNTLQFWR